MTPIARKEPEPQTPDQGLIRRIVEGDETALAILYDRYAGVVYSVANRILRDTGAAEEILQDIFYQLWRGASTFDFARGTVPGWLLVTARNRGIDRLRRRSHDPGYPLPEHLIVSHLNLEDAAFRNELMTKVRAALAELPEPQRQAMELAYFEGLTHTEIAARTGDALGTVKTRLRSALQTVKRALSL